MSDIGAQVTAVVGMVLTVAIIAVIVGKNAQTSGVLSSAGGALSSVIQAAVAPVS